MNKEYNISYIQDNLTKPLVLVGMMGVGKSHLGSLLAGALSIPFFDVDRVVEDKAGCSVVEIFEEYGEAKFRRAEKNTILELLDERPCVIATGGGAVVNDEARGAIKNRGLSLWLDSDVECLFKRLEKATNRPLLQADNPKEILEKLLKERAPFYKQMDIRVTSADDDIYMTLTSVLAALSEHIKDERR